nr:glycosyltransferase [Gramella jeungdoensis]
MATYNRESFINDALNSIKEQTYSNWECIVVDDGSADNTREILKGWTEKDNRFKYVQRPDDHKKGLPGSRNYGLSLASGNYIIFFDDDDIVHPANLETCVSLLKNNSVFFCRYDKQPFNETSDLGAFATTDEIVFQNFGVDRIDEMITGEVPFASCGVMWKKDCFENLRFNEDLMYAEEWECYTRILIKGFQGVSINEVLYYNRKHSNSNTGQFYKNDPVRRGSYIKAIKMVIDHLQQAGLLSRKLEIFFLRMGFFLKEYSVIKYTLDKSEAGKLRRIKFSAGYKLYPVLRPVFILKKKLKDLLK